MHFTTVLSLTALLSLVSAVVLPSTGRRSPDELFKRFTPTCPNDIHSNQDTTYYFAGTSPTQTTACGSHYNPDAMTAAITVQLENAIGGIDNACARQIVVVDAETGTTIVLAIEDSNATPIFGEYSLDITPAAYEALGGSTAESDPGHRVIEWYLIDGVAVCF